MQKEAGIFKYQGEIGLWMEEEGVVLVTQTFVEI